MVSINSRTNITQKGRVVVNAAFDKEAIRYRKTAELKPGGRVKKVYENSLTDDKFMHIVPGEPLFMHKQRSAVGGVKKRKLVHDTDLLVFSSFNGLLCKTGATIEDVEKNLMFAGFADIQSIYNSDGYTNIDAVTQVGGLRTTVNTGESEIKAGDMVYWKMPTAREARGKQKVLASLHPVRKHDVFNNDKIKEMLTSADESSLQLQEFTAMMETRMSGATGPIGADYWADVISGLCKHFFEPEYKKLKGRIVGKAVSSAKPGAPFDIKIGGSYSI